MTSTSKQANDVSDSSPGWTEGLFGVIAGTGAGLCCAGPLLFGALGFSGIAGTLASLPFVYHVILQWIAVLIMGGTWTWFLYKWFQLPDDQRWNRATIVTSVILLGISVYVIRSWIIHVLT